VADPAKSAPLDVDGPAAPPRSNGELLFAAPWESRLFGVTMALHEAGHFEWEEFRRLLIEEIARWERNAAQRPDVHWSYYGCWHAALERLLASRGLCGAAEIETRTEELAARPPGHDH
jgi:nitrile hydratase accessory protein